jgi:hypothetical protein
MRFVQRRGAAAARAVCALSTAIHISTEPQRARAQNVGNKKTGGGAAKQSTTSGSNDAALGSRAIRRRGIRMVELIGAAFILLCLAPLLARDPHRSSR